MPAPPVVHRRPVAVVVATLVLVAASGCASGSGQSSQTSASPGRGSATSPTAHPPSTTAEATTTTSPPAHLRASVVGPPLTQPLSRAVAVPRHGSVLVLGGRTAAKVSTAEVATWTPGGAAVVTGSLARRVHDSSVTVLGDHTLVLGGGDGGSVSDVQDVDASGHGVGAGRLPTARSDLSAATVGGTAYVLGGFDDRAGVVEVLATTDGRSFRSVAALPGEVRYGAVVAVGGQVLVFGGEDEQGATDAVLGFDPGAGRVSQVATLPVALSHASAFVLEGRVYVAGGRTGDRRHGEIWRYDPGSKTFTQVGTLPEARSDAAVAVVGDTAYLLGGETPATLDSVVAVTAG
ncbi:MAG: kelch repeat-containing protein [Acidimicrobiales bacterium]